VLDQRNGVARAVLRADSFAESPYRRFHLRVAYDRANAIGYRAGRKRATERARGRADPVRVQRPKPLIPIVRDRDR